MAFSAKQLRALRRQPDRRVAMGRCNPVGPGTARRHAGRASL